MADPNRAVKHSESLSHVDDAQALAGLCPLTHTRFTLNVALLVSKKWIVFYALALNYERPK